MSNETGPIFSDPDTANWRRYLIRIKLLGLFFSLLTLLTASAFMLRSTVTGSLQVIDRQNVIIQTLQATTTAEKQSTGLRWAYLKFLGNPSVDNYRAVDAKLTIFQDALGTVRVHDLQSKLENIRSLAAGLEATSADIMKAKPDSSRANTLEAEATRELTAIDEGMANLVNDLEEMLTATSNERRIETSALRALPDAFMFGGLLTLLFATLVIVLQITNPLGRLHRAMLMASADPAGARKYALKVARRDEIGLATTSFNSLLNSVSDGIERITTAEQRLRETGQQMQAIMDNVADGIITLDADGIIETFSPSAEKIFQRYAGDAVGHRIGDLLLDARGETFDLMPRLISRSGETFGPAPSEVTASLPDGQTVPLEMAIGRADFGGRMVHVVTLRDISARRHMETFMERAQRMELIGRMTGGIAHDFNNMLTVISGNFELISLKLKDADPILKSMVAMGLDTVKKGKDMTQRLLAVSSKQLLKPETMDLSRRLETITALIRHAVPEDIHLESSVAPTLWHVRVDPVQFESALLNLAINARDAMQGRTGGVIAIEAGNVTIGPDTSFGTGNVTPGEYVMIAVRDNGDGIPAAVIDRVFEPFFTTKMPGKGTGLGLSMVYGFTRQSGGHIMIDSNEGKGTVIRLYFPRSIAALDGLMTAAAHDDDYVPTGTESLLVVEDEPDVLAYLTQTLSDLGYRVTSATDAATALDRLDGLPGIDMLLTDVVMPGEMNGEALAHEVRHRLPALPVLFISGYTRDALVEQGTLKTGVSLLAKPFTRIDLAQYVRAVLDGA